MKMLIAILSLIALCVSGAGCSRAVQRLAPSTPYVMIVDEFYMTRGASQAILGSYGFVDTVGFDSFERVGYKPELVKGLKHRRMWLRCSIDENLSLTGSASTKEYGGIDAGSVTVDFNDLNERTIALEVYDVNRAEFIPQINSEPSLLDELRSNSSYRIITAVAEITDYNSFSHREFAANVGAEANMIGNAEADLRSRYSARAFISPKTVYAYQMSHIEWDENLCRVVALKTDHPIVTDKLTRGTTIHNETSVANGRRCDDPENDKDAYCLERLPPIREGTCGDMAKTGDKRSMP